MPSARLYDEGVAGVTIYDGTPDQKITITSSPYDWLEASFFYTNVQGAPYCFVQEDPVCNQDYKDKGFNFKIRLKKEGIFPAIAVGINDIAGTGLYGSEYIVGSYGMRNLDLHFGLGWGNLNGTKDFKNPFILFYNGFNNRPNRNEGQGGNFQPGRYFSNKEVSTFYGLTYAVNENLLFKIEHDTTLTPGQIGFDIPSNRISYGLDLTVNRNFTVGLFSERDNFHAIACSLPP